MNKTDFVELMTGLVVIKEVVNKLVEVLDSLDFNGFTIPLASRYEALIVNALQAGMNDKSEWISYWLYELNCGKNYRDGCVKVHHKNVPLKTIEDLYNCIKMK